MASPADTEERLQTALGWWLRIGAVTVAAGMGIALIWTLVSETTLSLHGPPAWPPALGFDPQTLVLATGLLLVLIPPSRVLLAAVAFALEGNWRYVAFSLVALTLIAASTVLGIWLKRG